MAEARHAGRSPGLAWRKADALVAAVNRVAKSSLRRGKVSSTDASPTPLDDADEVTVRVALTVEARDPGTAEHCQRLSRYATALGQRIGLGADDLATLRRGGYLHDIGKIAIPTSILQKRGALSRDERTLVEQHTLIGDRFCAAVPALQHVRPIVRHHHERLDGSGYPDRLRGDAIPLLARIVGIVDVFDALITERPYKTAWSFDRAAEVLKGEAARGWRCADLVSVFLSMAARYGVSDTPTRAAGRRKAVRMPLTRLQSPLVLTHSTVVAGSARRTDELAHY